MILSRFPSLALGCALLLGAVAAGAANQDAPAAPTPPASDETAPQPAPGSSEPAATAAAPAEAEPERICRYVKLDASSRRKTKVCRTTEEWRELNNIR
jgi:hypothetical protein